VQKRRKWVGGYIEVQAKRNNKRRNRIWGHWLQQSNNGRGRRKRGEVAVGG